MKISFEYQYDAVVVIHSVPTLSYGRFIFKGKPNKNILEIAERSGDVEMLQQQYTYENVFMFTSQNLENMLTVLKMSGYNLLVIEEDSVGTAVGMDWTIYDRQNPLTIKFK